MNRLRGEVILEDISKNALVLVTKIETSWIHPSCPHFSRLRLAQIFCVKYRNLNLLADIPYFTLGREHKYNIFCGHFQTVKKRNDELQLKLDFSIVRLDIQL